jgi:hypothetical protein
MKFMCLFKMAVMCSKNIQENKSDYVQLERKLEIQGFISLIFYMYTAHKKATTVFMNSKNYYGKRYIFINPLLDTIRYALYRMDIRYMVNCVSPDQLAHSCHPIRLYTVCFKSHWFISD